MFHFLLINCISEKDYIGQRDINNVFIPRHKKTVQHLTYVYYRRRSQLTANSAEIRREQTCKQWGIQDAG